MSYEFQIDNDGDSVPDVTYSATFGPSAGGNQTVAFSRNGGVASIGTTGIAFPTTSNNGELNGGNVLAGRFDDPFFFDLMGFQDGFAFTGDDAFAGADVSAIVFEVPSSEITSAGSTAVGIQAVTTVGGTQVDRIGRPAINTVLIPSDRKDEFNAASPDADFMAFGDDVNAAIAGLSNQANADTLTSILLPDLLTFDTSNPDGFLNGRQLADDVIDAELGLLSAGAVTTDGVDTNDSPFLTVFPFLAAANTAAVPEPGIASLGLIAVGCLATRRRRRQTKLDSNE